MDAAAFWALIEETHAASDDIDDQVELLIERLTTFEVEALFDFQRHFEEAIRDAYSFDLWAIAYIINGGCSDDGFDYFLGWLIAHGEAPYRAALAAPASIAELADPDDDEHECGDMWVVASLAYARKTGLEDFYDLAPGVTRTLKGEHFDEDELEVRHPELWARFMG